MKKTELVRAVHVMMTQAKRIYILKIKVKKSFSYFIAVFSKRNRKHVLCVFLFKEISAESCPPKFDVLKTNHDLPEKHRFEGKYASFYKPTCLQKTFHGRVLPIRVFSMKGALWADRLSPQTNTIAPLSQNQWSTTVEE